MLSIGIASTGVLTFAYFAIASHLLKGRSYSHLDVLWSVMFVIICVIYRPVEQLLSRTIADHEARGIARPPMRVPLTIQGAFALVFLAVALPLHHLLAHRVFESYVLEAFRQWRFKLSDHEYTVEVTCFFEFTEGKCEGSDVRPITPETYVSAELPSVVRVRTGFAVLG